MARGKAGQKKKATRRKRPAKAAAVILPKPAAAATSRPTGGEAPVRGVKLKTVSFCTIIFALVCLGAFMAGRPPASAEAVAARPTSARTSTQQLRHDDARSLLRRNRSRERKAGPQEFEKSP